jgi:hypothetical protein
MEPIGRHVRDIDPAERRMLEHVIGRKLKDNQKVMIQVVTLGSEAQAVPQPADAVPADELPDWCNVYEGLSEEEIDALESIVLQRANLTRPSS